MNLRKKKDTHFSHTHPSRKLILIRIMIPEVGIHSGKLVMSKTRGEHFIPIEGLRPPITDGRGRGESLHSSITTGSRGKDKGVGGGHFMQR